MQTFCVVYVPICFNGYTFFTVLELCKIVEVLLKEVRAAVWKYILIHLL